MRHRGRVALILIATFLFLQGVADAKLFSGKVVSIDPQAGQLVISQVDPISGSLQEQSFSAGSETEYVGVLALDELEVGDEVAVSAEEAVEGEALKAASIELVENEEPAAQT